LVSSGADCLQKFSVLKILTPGDELLESCALECKISGWPRTVGKNLKPTHCFVVCLMMNGVLQVKGC